MGICHCLIRNISIGRNRLQNKIDRPALWIYFKNICSLFLFYLLSVTIRKQRNSNTKNILFINTGQIGDLIITTTLIVNENLFDPKSAIYLLIRDEYKNLFESYKGKIQFIDWNRSIYKRSLIYRYHILRKLNKLNLCTAVNLTTARGPINDELTLLSGAVNKYCLSNDSRYLKRIFRWIYNRYYSDVLDFSNVTEFEKQINTLEFLTGKSPQRALKLDVDEGYRQWAKQYFQKYTVNGTGKFIIIQPFSDLEVKNWSFENYKTLIYKLNKLEVIIFCQGNRKQRDRVNELIIGLENVYNIAGELTLIESSALLSLSELFIGNDSGFTHIAKALNKNRIAIIGCGSSGIFFPYLNSENEKLIFKPVDCAGCEWRCIHSKRYCIENVTPEEVFETVVKFLR